MEKKESMKIRVKEITSLLMSENFIKLCTPEKEITLQFEQTSEADKFTQFFLKSLSSAYKYKPNDLEAEQ